MIENKISSQFWRRLLYFFPFQLVVLHIKRNQILLLLWIILWGFISGRLAAKYGVPYLFLSPEYLGNVDFWSFTITGFSLGGLIMAFNISTYIIHGTKFPFLATVSRPFYKYCLNNSIIPITFIGIYMVKIVSFQINKELIHWSELLIDLGGFLLGIALFFGASVFYFWRTNKDVFKISGKTQEDLERKPREENVETTFIKAPIWYRVMNKREAWPVRTYIAKFPFKLMLTRESKHYDKELLQKVFSQNHINASIFEVVLVISFLLLGIFREVRVFEIPAAASVFLLFTILLMVFSALYSWFKGWTVTVFIGLVILFNGLSARYTFLTENHAYGLNYSVEQAVYSIDERKNFVSQENVGMDTDSMLVMLEQWKVANTINGEKPKLVLLNVSGGGLRSSLWTYTTLQKTDSALNGKLMDQIFMIAGASGGMIGASYFRELYLQKTLGEDIDLGDSVYFDNISKDILNPALFAIATNDVFIRYQRFEYGGYSYIKDRGYAFEKRLNENTEGIMDRSFADYWGYERDGTIPFMVFSPTIVNDGRRLLIANPPISFLANSVPSSDFNTDVYVEDVEFMRLFKQQDATNLRFLSAIRMSATFPYILPMVTLPTEPQIEVMDAGLRDNYGMKTTLQFLLVFKDWIDENTSGVVILQTRDRQEGFEEENGITSWLDRLTSPLGVMYKNFTRIHDFEHDRLLQQLSAWYQTDLDVCTFSLYHNRDENISLSFHLTALEKKRILNSMNLPQNQDALNKITTLLRQ